MVLGCPYFESTTGNGFDRTVNSRPVLLACRILNQDLQFIQLPVYMNTVIWHQERHHIHAHIEKKRVVSLRAKARRKSTKKIESSSSYNHKGD
ncbi:hypothetical protein K1719_027725 [Acacia pycnantha]|nr:hypothetical protein K1719_027725 [Acacia pycnantha]